ncbi:MAG: serine--tRNA ligase [Saprospiraceae bacterium]|nr:serine--tRNA ligase [Saprospiraceae bacterium]
MLQIQVLRDQKERVILGLKKKHFQDAEVIVDKLVALDDDRKSIQRNLNDIQADSNKLAAEIGQLIKNGLKEEAEVVKQKVATLKIELKNLEDALKQKEVELETLLITLPNLPHESVPVGKTPEENEVYKMSNIAIPDLGENPLPHWDLAKKYNIFDLELGVKITGAGFPLYRGKGAKLQRALINFFLDEAHAAGYEEIIPPLMVNEDSARGTGNLPDKEAQMYHVTKDDLYLIPTAEVPITNIFRGDILDEKVLPIKMTGYTPCFRREAGSYGAHVRGLNRVHQFDKIEIVQFAHPKDSYDIQLKMLEHVEGILIKLGLPYRILRLCGGDMSFSSALTFDFEVFSAAQKRWLEVSSVSNFESFQSNRMQTKFRDENKKVQLIHTLNGSALALARIVASIIENYQCEEGIKIPEVLQKYTGFDILN